MMSVIEPKNLRGYIHNVSQIKDDRFFTAVFQRKEKTYWMVVNLLSFREYFVASAEKGYPVILKDVTFKPTTLNAYKTEILYSHPFFPHNLEWRDRTVNEVTLAELTTDDDVDNDDLEDDRVSRENYLYWVEHYKYRQSTLP